MGPVTRETKTRSEAWTFQPHPHLLPGRGEGLETVNCSCPCEQASIKISKVWGSDSISVGNQIHVRRAEHPNPWGKKLLRSGPFRTHRGTCKSSWLFTGHLEYPL